MPVSPGCRTTVDWDFLFRAFRLVPKHGAIFRGIKLYIPQCISRLDCESWQVSPVVNYESCRYPTRQRGFIPGGAGIVSLLLCDLYLFAGLWLDLNRRVTLQVFFLERGIKL